MKQLQKLWASSWGKGLLVGLPLAAVLLSVVIYAAMQHPVNLGALPSSAAQSSSAPLLIIDEEPEDSEPVQPESSKESTLEPIPIWTENTDLSTTTYTLPAQVEMQDGSLGLLTIQKLGLTVNVFETDDEMEAMTKGVAHFKITSAWDGNIGLCAHNVNFDGSDGYFKNLYTLQTGDIITYKTELGERNYKVTTVKEVADDDWSYLVRTEDNRITMITCISGKTDKRLCVQGIETA